MICLLLTLTMTLSYKLFGNTTALIIAATALISFLLIQWPMINTTGRLLLAAALLSTLLLGWTSDPLYTLSTAFSRASYFATFLVALAFLRLASKHSLMVKRCGNLVVNQPPALRYTIISYSSYLFGTLLNFGVIHLLSQMISRGNSLKSAGGQVRIQNIRRRRMSLALLRGFCVLPLASPFSIAMTLILAIIPNLQWLSLLPIGIATASILILIGVLLDFMEYPAPAAIKCNNLVLNWRPAWQFLTLILSIFLLAVLIEKITTATLPIAIMILSPPAGILWMSWSRRMSSISQPLSKMMHILRAELPSELNSLRSEIGVLSGACFFGVIISDLVPHDQLVQLIQTTGISGLPLAIITCASIPILAQLGLNPIVIVTILASILTPADSYELTSELLAISLMSGWCLALNCAPISISALMISSATGCSPRDITHRWNVVYTLISFIALSLWISFLAYFLHF